MESHEPIPVPHQEVGHYQSKERPRDNEGDSILPDVKKDTGGERIEAKMGLASEPPLPIAPQPTAQLPAPLANDPLATDHNISSSTNPLVAADDDLIEQEWVKKAKVIIEQTKTDPRLQESEVSKLQADYLKKRYGKEVPLTGNS